MDKALGKVIPKLDISNNSQYKALFDSTKRYNQGCA